MPDKIQCSIEIQKPEQVQSKISTLLAQKSMLPASTIKKAMQNGAVWLTRGKSHRRIRRATSTIKIGDTIALYYDARVQNQEPLAAQLLYDGEQYSVWHKPSGMLCQGSLWGDHTTLARFSEKQFQPIRQSFQIHRLDKATSGIVIITHSKSYAKELASRFEKRTVTKIYQAIVHGNAVQQIPDGLTLTTKVDGKHACSHIKPIAQQTLDDKNYSLLEVQIETGRKHQIRQHLASIDLPIVGDRLYGNAKADDIDLQLRAVRLSFDEPLHDGKQTFEINEKDYLQLIKLSSGQAVDS